MKTLRYLGLMSGTSMNGVDAAVCEFDDARLSRLLATHTEPYPAALRQRLLDLVHQQPALTLNELSRLDADVARVFADAARAALRKSPVPPEQVDAIGSHGQTVFHAPDATPGTTLQIGDPNRIATLTGLTTVADFRRRDVALGGQGAPLVPAFHHAQFTSASEPRAVVNLGGIANLTVLPGDAVGVRGFDTGPGNGLMDAWAQETLHRAHDENGQWAATGEVDPRLLKTLLDEPYFQRSPPKSTGRTEFSLDRCRQRVPNLATLDPADVQRTFCELTARSIADALHRYAAGTQRVLLCGGGVRNGFLVTRLRALLAPIPVELTDAHGLDAEWVEAAAFAWLAMRTRQGLPGNLPGVTGASAATVLGGIYPANPR